ncbi:MAG: hypothetical protein LBG60_03450 [Bifidobacteriaceae bacterium]|jgi:hypothetical protein|nr:hypothetical protein [Bifidobacteriaceae bacterium]
MRSRRLAGVCLVGVLALASGSCANAPESSPATASGGSAASDWTADAYLDGIANDAINDPAVDEPQKDVLKRFVQSRDISESDWKESNSRYVVCMAGKGYAVHVDYLGEKTQTVTEFEPAADEAELQAARDADLECGIKTSLFVNQLYAEINRPGGPMDPLDSDRSIHQCYIDRGIIPADVSFEQFEAEIQKYFDLSQTDEEAMKCVQDAPV